MADYITIQVNKNNVSYSELFYDRSIKTYLVICDQHYPHQQKQLMLNIVKLAKDIRPYGLINLGDAIDLESISYFIRDKPLKKQGLRLKNDIQQLHLALSQFDQVDSIKQKHFIMGNHQDRLAKYIDQKSQLEGLVDLQEIIQTHGYEYHGVGCKVKIGDWYFGHGTNYGKYHVMKDIDQLGANSVVGHSHTLQVQQKSSINGIVRGIALGCLCQLNPTYMQGKNNRWSHNFGLLHLAQDGRTFFEIIDVKDNSFYYNGIIYQQ